MRRGERDGRLLAGPSSGSWAQEKRRYAPKEGLQSSAEERCSAHRVKGNQGGVGEYAGTETVGAAPIPSGVLSGSYRR